MRSLIDEKLESGQQQQFNPPFEALIDYFNGGDQLEQFLERFTNRTEDTPANASTSSLSEVGR